MGKKWCISKEKLLARSIKLKKYYLEHPDKKPIPPSRKGIKQSEEAKRKFQETISKRGPRKIKSGLNSSESHLKYYKEHPEAKDRISKDRKKWFSENRDKLIKENSSNWKGGITPLVRQIRKCFKMRQWVCDVFTRDGYKCVKCCKGGALEAHHSEKRFADIFKASGVKSIEEALEHSEFWNINYGITLCKSCHKEEHKK